MASTYIYIFIEVCLSILVLLLFLLLLLAQEPGADNGDKERPKPEVVVYEPGTFFEPDDSHNQMFDKAASDFFFRRCQELGVRIIAVSRFAAYAAQMPRGTYDRLALMGSSIGRRSLTVNSQERTTNQENIEICCFQELAETCGCVCWGDLLCGVGL